jgi:chemotaxis signal transduction protein
MREIVSPTAAASDADDASTLMLLFRVGGELFAMALSSSEEVLEWPGVERVAGMSQSALGVFPLRGGLVSVYSPERALRVRREEEAGVLLIIRARGRRIALALDDVEEVIQVELGSLKRPSPREAADGLLLGIARHGDSLVAVVDVEALAAACIDPQAGELQ